MLSLLICVFVQESLLDADHHVAVALGAAHMSGSAASVFYRDDASVLSSVSVHLLSCYYWSTLSLIIKVMDINNTRLLLFLDSSSSHRLHTADLLRPRRLGLPPD